MAVTHQWNLFAIAEWDSKEYWRWENSSMGDGCVSVTNMPRWSLTRKFIFSLGYSNDGSWCEWR